MNDYQVMTVILVLVAFAAVGFFAIRAGIGCGQLVSKAPPCPPLDAACREFQVPVPGREPYTEDVLRQSCDGDVLRKLDEMADEWESPLREMARKADLHDELMLAVKWELPGETRHETALRQIQERQLRYEGRGYKMYRTDRP